MHLPEGSLERRERLATYREILDKVAADGSSVPPIQPVQNQSLWVQTVYDARRILLYRSCEDDDLIERAHSLQKHSKPRPFVRNGEVRGGIQRGMHQSFVQIED